MIKIINRNSSVIENYVIIGWERYDAEKKNKSKL